MYTPKPGDIGLVKTRGAGGRIIRFLQWLNGDGYDDFEHAFMVSRIDSRGRIWIVEAEPKGARETVLKRTGVRWLICPDEYRAACAEAARSLIGTLYSWADYLSLALHRFHIPAPHLKAYIKESKHMICSQLVDHAAMLGGWHLFADGRWEGDVTPGDLNLLWETLPAGARA